MIPAYTGAQVRAAEQPLLDAGAGPGLMRRAAHGLARHTAELLRRERGRVYGTRAAALVGTGNNGGDALFAMAFLTRRGVACTAVLLGEKAHDAGLAAFRRAGGRVVDGRPGNNAGAQPREDEDTDDGGTDDGSPRWRAAVAALAGADVVIDAVLGTGARGGIELPLLPNGALVVACDLPSGVDADTGNAADSALEADLTVTFGALKTGLAVGRGHLLAGRVEVVDIGLGPHLGDPDLYVIERSDVARLLPRPARDAHKYSRGVLGLVAGCDRYPGAAVLSATAAVNAGLGMLRTVALGRAAELLAHAVPEAVPAEDTDVRVQAWAVGPGIGDDAGQLAAAKRAIASGLPCVVDASALRRFEPSDGRGNIVLTPHAGELQDLLTRAGLDVEAGDIAADPVRWARRAASTYSSVVLLKGPATVCAAPDGYTVVCNAGGPELATAGSGDVLTGIIGKFLATGNQLGDTRSLVQVAATAAAVHGLTVHTIGSAATPQSARALAERVSAAVDTVGN
ncbi:NAD(P)H-hydrate dehydratase [Arthrobacter halodurans]|uniref:ADP-dependent (S)-NAD(P)H-hydrate dehydratase n=1 Tax=Arthrobacter halodurans TaxID=516699 RepID=A0ABV4ULY4_9MICC